MPEARRPSVPAPVRTAVRLMYAGAVASLVGILVDLTALNATKTAIEKQSANLPANQANSVQQLLMVGWIVGGLVGAGLWIVIARACLRGRNWARITGTVLFGIATLEALGNLVAPVGVQVKIFWFVIWLIGLGAVSFLWRRGSTAFFTGSQP